MFCWGSNELGQVRPEPMAVVSVPELVLPTRVDLAQRASSLAVSPHRSCAVLESEEVHCWGIVDVHDPLASPSREVVRVPGLSAVKDLSLGLQHACAVTSDGRVWCWGDNRFGQLGLGTRTIPSDPPRRPLLAQAPAPQAPAYGAVPTLVPGVRDALRVVTGDRASCALTAAHAVVCWGDGFECAGPVEMPELGPASALSGSRGAYCALRETDGAILRLPALDTSTEGVDNCHAYVPRQQEPILRAARRVVCGGWAGCAVLAGGELSCFGLGNAELDPLLANVVASRPRALGFALARDDNSACLITLEHRLLCWGDNRHGQLGVPPTSILAEPTEPRW